ncbi:MAG: ATP-dependent protease ATPase subunit HslU [Myxococcales bacterium]|jgi:ATP-dependent HslUV protease ATP-binding subunit HslU
MARSVANFTPREIVGELDRYVIGQAKAKRAVAIALRNRWRRQQVPEDLREEIVPKNIIMIGPTGVGKTEIARRLSRLAQAPFVKVEASKFTEVGYVGRDVESIIRDLVEVAVGMVRQEQLETVRTRATEHAERRLLELLSGPAAGGSPAGPPSIGPFTVSSAGTVTPPGEPIEKGSELDALRKELRAGALDDRMVELEVQDSSSPLVSVLGGQGFEQMEQQLQDMLGNLPGLGGKRERRKMRVADARRVLEDEEAQKLIDHDKVKRDAVARTESSGIVFLDEIDKVAGGQKGQGGPDVSREGVQRDLLPIVEGSTVNTKYGQVKTDHILFVAAGAFHVARVSDLIPELQGRFPIRVELESLGKGEFVRILTEPKNSLTRQYAALMHTEGLELTFTDDAIEAIAGYAEQANRRAENIGARRLHTIMEALLDELSFDASERSESRVEIDGEQVRRVLGPLMEDQDLARFIL